MKSSILINKTIVSLCLSSFILLLYSCSTSTKTCGSDFDQMKITKQGIIQKPLIVDLDINKDKKSATKNYSFISVSSAKEVIMGDFVNQYKCDLIVHPTFNYCINSENNSKNITITVDGFPAFYKNFRNFEMKDTLGFIPKNFQILQPEKSLSTSSDIQVVAQKKPTTHKSVFSIGADAYLPIGDMADYWSLGVGGSLQGAFYLSDKLAITVNAGYINYFGKKLIFYKQDDLKVIPVMGGIKYGITNNLYVHGQAGLSFWSLSGSNENDFTWNLGLGYNITHSLDLALKFNSIGTNGSASNAVGLRLGYNF